jgi:pimeloyl-ACP methyl ester carboxylesterase
MWKASPRPAAVPPCSRPPRAPTCAVRARVAQRAGWSMRGRPSTATTWRSPRAGGRGGLSRGQHAHQPRRARGGARPLAGRGVLEDLVIAGRKSAEGDRTMIDADCPCHGSAGRAGRRLCLQPRRGPRRALGGATAGARVRTACAQDCASFTRREGPVALLMVHGFGSSPAVFHVAGPTTWPGAATPVAPCGCPGFGEPLAARAHRQRPRTGGARSTRRSPTSDARTGQVWLVGHSMGGALCAEAALRRADDVDGVVLLAPLCEVSRRRSLGVPPERLFGLRHRMLPCTDTLETCFPIRGRRSARWRSWTARDRFVPLNIYEGMFEVMRARARRRAAAAPAGLGGGGT